MKNLKKQDTTHENSSPGPQGGVPPLTGDSPLAALVDVDDLQRILLNFSKSLGISAAIIDVEGNVLAASPWQRLCMQFHRANEITCARCIESDTSLAHSMQQGSEAAIYNCRNGLTDAAAPIIVEGRHLANLFTGQFLRSRADEAVFRNQAAEFGFNQRDYLAALREVPVVPEEKIGAILGFMGGFSHFIASLAEEKLHVQAEVKKNLEQERLLIHQSRLAAMGEMVGNIAHQWRQPLNALTILIANLKDAYDFNELDKAMLDRAFADANRLTQKMSSTIDDFRNFFAPNKEKTVFDVNKAITDALGIVSATLRNQAIEVTVEIEKGLTAYGFPNEYSQVFLNIISNAKDAIVARGVARGKIGIRIGKAGNEILLSVEDNGGGIPEDVLQKIFDPYFTTKDKGAGIGLYMSQVITKNMDGGIEVRNTDEGAVFTVSIPATAPALLPD